MMYSTVSDVQIWIIKANGQLTIHKKPPKAIVSIEDLGLEKFSSGLTYPVFIDGILYKEVLKSLKLNEDWFHQQLRKLNIDDLTSVFFTPLSEQNELHVSLRMSSDKEGTDMPPIFH